MQFSLKTLLIFVTLAGVTGWIVHLVTRPFDTIARVNCAEGRYVELLRPNEFCDVSGPVHFRFSGMKQQAQPPSFAMYGCGDRPNLVAMPGTPAHLVALTEAEYPDEISILIDLQTGTYWPQTFMRQVTPQAESMLQAIRDSDREVWLSDTYDGRLTKPRSL